MIYIYTHAYNASKMLPRTIESILNQTNQDFVWYLCDNASTDNTKKTILRYAEKDKRIIPEFRDINHLDPNYKGCLFFWLPTLISICENGNDDDFFCTLDADDEYTPDYFEKMLCFIKKNALEVAACGTTFINAATNSTARIRNLDQNLILDSNKKFGAHFTEYYQFIRAIWGKLYRLSLLKRCDYENYINSREIPYGIDTLFCMRAFSRANRAGILAEPLHKYYISKTNVSFSFDNKRIIADQILDDEVRKFLIDKTGKISPINNKFCKVTYFFAIVDTFEILIKSKISIEEKIVSIKDIILNSKTQALFLSDDVYEFGLHEKLRVPVTRFLLPLKECRKPDIAETAGEIIMTMYSDLQQIVSRDGFNYIILKMPEMIEYLLQKDYKRILKQLRRWYKQHDVDDPLLTELEISACLASGNPDEELFMLYIDNKKNRPRSFKSLDIETKLCGLIESYPLLKDMSVNLAVDLSPVICWVMKKDYQQALNTLISLDDVEIDDKSMEAYILFGQNLSAAAEDTGVYIYFKKVWISYLLDCSRTEEASKELNEFKQLLPDDEDFIALQNRLSEI